jgi:hypothetical protein
MILYVHRGMVADRPWPVGDGPFALAIKLVWGSFSFSISPFLLPLAWQSP